MNLDVTDDTPTIWYGYWQLISVDWTMNRYNCANVRDLGVELPAVQFRKTVTAENLPKGLKLVEDKCRELGVNVALSEVWTKGGKGATSRRTTRSSAASTRTVRPTRS